MRNIFTFGRYSAKLNLQIISIGAALVLFAAQPALALAQSSPAIVPLSSSTSANWAGYVAQGSTYSAVSGTWTVPTVAAANVSTAADATWVGIGGVSSQDLIQAGTQAVVENGSVQYEAWYELLPDYQTQIPLTVHAGDSITVSLSEISSNNWSLTFVDTTTGQTYQKMLAYNSSHSSAEWIEEMPVGGTSRNLNYLPLDNFGTTQFTNASAVANGTHENLSMANVQSLTMTTGNQTLATPSGIGSDGASFSVTRSNTAVTETNSYTQNDGRGWGRHGNGLQGFTRGQRTATSSPSSPQTNSSQTSTSTTTQIQRIVIPLSFLQQIGFGRMRFIFLQN